MDPSEGETIYGTEKETAGVIPESEPDYKDKNWLYTQYVVLQKSFQQIADENDWPSSTVGDWINKHDIPTRDMAKAVSIGKKKNAQYRDEEWLRKMYIDRKHSSREIAELCDTDEMIILSWLDRFDIETRSRGEGTRVRLEQEGYNKKYHDESWLRHQYEELKRSTYDIAEECGVADSTIQTWLKKHGIETRKGSKAQREPFEKQNHVILDTDDNTIQNDNGEIRLDYSWSDKKPGENIVYPLSNPSLLEELYHEKEMSIYEIADFIGCGHMVVYRRLKQYGIERRDLSEAQSLRK